MNKYSILVSIILVLAASASANLVLEEGETANYNGADSEHTIEVINIYENSASLRVNGELESFDLDEKMESDGINVQLNRIALTDTSFTPLVELDVRSNRSNFATILVEAEDESGNKLRNEEINVEDLSGREHHDSPIETGLDGEATVREGVGPYGSNRIRLSLDSGESRIVSVSAGDEEEVTLTESRGENEAEVKVKVFNIEGDPKSNVAVKLEDNSGNDDYLSYLRTDENGEVKFVENVGPSPANNLVVNTESGKERFVNLDGGEEEEIIFGNEGAFDLQPICDDCEEPRDLNNDSLYEDVNGDGIVNERDQLIMLENLNSIENIDQFDFFKSDSINDLDSMAIEPYITSHLGTCNEVQDKDVVKEYKDSEAEVFTSTDLNFALDDYTNSELTEEEMLDLFTAFNRRCEVEDNVEEVNIEDLSDAEKLVDQEALVVGPDLGVPGKESAEMLADDLGLDYVEEGSITPTEKSENHLILVGGSNINPLTEELVLDGQLQDDLEENSAKIDLVDGFTDEKETLVVRGYSSDNTEDGLEMLKRLVNEEPSLGEGQRTLNIEVDAEETYSDTEIRDIEFNDNIDYDEEEIVEVKIDNNNNQDVQAEVELHFDARESSSLDFTLTEQIELSDSNEEVEFNFEFFSPENGGDVSRGTTFDLEADLSVDYGSESNSYENVDSYVSESGLTLGEEQFESLNGPPVPGQAEDQTVEQEQSTTTDQEVEVDQEEESETSSNIEDDEDPSETNQQYANNQNDFDERSNAQVEETGVTDSVVDFFAGLF